MIASCICRGDAKVVVPDAGEEKLRGVPKAVTKFGAVNPVVLEKLKKVVFTSTTFERLKMLKASPISFMRMLSPSRMARVSRKST